MENIVLLDQKYKLAFMFIVYMYKTNIESEIKAILVRRNAKLRTAATVEIFPG